MSVSDGMRDTPVRAELRRPRPLEGDRGASSRAGTIRRAYANGCLAESFWATTESTVG